MADEKKVSSRASAKNTGKNGTGTKGQTRRSGRPVKSDKRVIDEIYAILFLAAGSFFVIAMHTQMAGALGEGLQYGLKGIFGLVAYGFSYALIAYGLMVFLKKAAHINGRTLTLFIILILCAATINAARYLGEIDQETFKLTLGFVKESFVQGAELAGGGSAGTLIGLGLQKLFGMAGLYIVCVSAGLVCILLLSNTPMSRGLDAMKEKRLQKRLDREAEWEAEEEENAAALQRQRQQPQQNQVLQDETSSKIMRKKKIMEYMADDDLFKEDQTSEEHLKEVEEKFNAEVSKKDTKVFKLSEATKAFIFGKKPHITQEVPAPPPMGLEDKDPYIQGVFAEVESEEVGTDQQEPDDFGTLALAGVQAVGIIETEESAIGVSSMPEISSMPVAQQEPYVAKIPEPVKMPENTGASLETNETSFNNEGLAGHRDESAKRPYVFPPIDLLNKAKATGGKDVLDAGVKTVLLEQTFKDFGVNAKILNVSKGPTVTRYEIQPGTGVKVSSIVRLSDDIALKLEAKSIRMEAPIPGKAAVGIEIENEKVQPVMIREVIESAAFKNHPSKISFAVGKDILGNAVIGDMAEMPHMLIAGSTGSGKSVCINSIISSFLYKASPEEVKLVLIDPKVVELSVYNGIPHLLVPVVTDPNKAAAALNWAVQEMDERYRKFAQTGVRKLSDFNERLKAAGEETMPQIVIVIDELADLMMVASSAVETAICRLAQKARAAGMHLIVATQRPSVDVITGVIKANIPSRVAFAVSSQIDSRTILDMAGAEKLVGKGDMLFNPLGKAKPTRVQGTFITDAEVENVIAHVKAQVAEEEPQAYSNDLAQAIETSKIAGGTDDGGDELLPEAIEFVVTAEQASVSMLQRRMRIGYNRAARLIDMMEERGIVGPADGSRPRTVLMSREELENLNEAGDMEFSIK